MPMSFREKSQWFVLATLLVVYGAYFVDVLPDHGADVMPSDMVRFAGALVTLVVLQIVGHALLAVADRRALSAGLQVDERDARIDLRASRWSSHVLATGAFAALVVALTVPGNFAFVHVLFGALVLAHVVELIARIALYRRGA